ncbi:hypothetical protein B0T17DRAFT_504301 [Bombardia bombarda]|uniref:Uncharacterized protein n=1 Tax=Bombardia bombarda TaxID=252184 RepID=A0AA40CGZ8_9PEZI|nr:hypothetical protein B0T17DRAFT_504301 [Bombardia bombarda]
MCVRVRYWSHWFTGNKDADHENTGRGRDPGVTRVPLLGPAHPEPPRRDGTCGTRGEILDWPARDIRAQGMSGSAQVTIRLSCADSKSTVYQLAASRPDRQAASVIRPHQSYSANRETLKETRLSEDRQPRWFAYDGKWMAPLARMRSATGMRTQAQLNGRIKGNFSRPFLGPAASCPPQN